MTSNMISKNKDVVLGIISEIASIPVNSICIQDSLIEIGIDSLMTVELLIRIEEKLGIVFDEADLDPETLSTVESIMNLVALYEGK